MPSLLSRAASSLLIRSELVPVSSVVSPSSCTWTLLDQTHPFSPSVVTTWRNPFRTARLTSSRVSPGLKVVIRLPEDEGWERNTTFRLTTTVSALARPRKTITNTSTQRTGCTQTRKKLPRSVPAISKEAIVFSGEAEFQGKEARILLGF